jgi:20S proteasome alpha/beta subunit
MTIGIGFLCSDGVVLCSDRQLTSSSGFKYEERKILWTHSDFCTVIFGYAGETHAAQVMYRKIRENFQETAIQAKGKVSTDKARNALEKIFKDKNSKELETLIGIRLQHSPPYLFKTWGNKVVDGLAEYIGAGDSSALRYLSGFLIHDQLDVSQATIIGTYIVSVANRYVDKCGGGPDYTVLHENGMVTEGTGGPFPNQRERIVFCEQEIGKELRRLLFSGGTR